MSAGSDSAADAEKSIYYETDDNNTDATDQEKTAEEAYEKE